jgi:hypothetical protein
MLRKLLDAVKGSVGGSQSKGILIGRQGVAQYWTGNHEVTKDFTKEMIKDTAAQMMEEVAKVDNSADPRMANRKIFAKCVLNYAQFQVLIIDAPPAQDATGLRGKPGITGELKPHLMELADKDKSLREYLHGLPLAVPLVRNEVWDAVLFRFRVMYAWAHVFHLLRAAYGDYNAAPGKDWFQPFVIAMCANQEHQYRQCLGLPPALVEADFDADAQALIMSGFYNCVMSGARYPDLEWQDRLQRIEIHKTNKLYTLASIGVVMLSDTVT